MKKVKIGYIYSEKFLKKDEKFFLKQAKKKNVDLIMINLLKGFEIGELEKILEGCKIVFNNSAEEEAVEVVKTIEELGKIVIDSSEVYYYDEDKWMFYLKCWEHKVPTPKTFLLSENLNLARKEIIEFASWPLVIKRISGTNGDYVELADTEKQSEKIIKKFWKKGGEKQPVIIQEFIKSPSYRLTTLDGKILQTAIKNNKGGWKCTGVYEKKYEKFTVTKELKTIAKKIFHITKIHFCGIDLLKKEDSWLVLEANADPAFDFFEDEREKMIGTMLDYLKKKARKNHLS